MVLLRFDTTPTTGFMTDFQATQISYPINNGEFKNLFDVLVAYSDESQRHIDEMINQLRSSGNFYEANAYARLLFENSKFTSEQINKIAEAHLSNYEIRGGFVSNPKCLELFQNNWKKIEPKYRDKIKLFKSTGS